MRKDDNDDGDEDQYDERERDDNVTAACAGASSRYSGL